jgi:hypothetical protein
VNLYDDIEVIRLKNTKKPALRQELDQHFRKAQTGRVRRQRGQKHPNQNRYTSQMSRSIVRPECGYSVKIYNRSADIWPAFLRCHFVESTLGKKSVTLLDESYDGGYPTTSRELTPSSATRGSSLSASVSWPVRPED